MGSGNIGPATAGPVPTPLISYNTGTRALPDIYALALGAAPLGIVRILYQAKHSCLCYNLYLLHFAWADQRVQQFYNYHNVLRR